jgi:GNAT superfamily N-acetyltransferase
MVERCSRRTRQRRFLGAAAAIPPTYLARVCLPHPGDLHLVAVSGSQVVALGSRADDELGLLVEDEWQSAGVGRLLLRRLLEHSCAPLLAEVGDGNDRMLSWLRRLAPRRVAPQSYGWRVVLDPRASLAALDERLREAA